MLYRHTIYRLVYIVIGLMIWVDAFAIIRLNVGIVHQRGVGTGLTIVSELYVVEDVLGKEAVVFKMNNGVTLKLNAMFSNSLKEFGPSSMINITGSLYNSKGEVIRIFNEGEIVVKIGEEKLIINKTLSDQVIELSILPTVR
ncbi:MAG: hypothetical protein ISR65_02375 [Bacteriovoracaceae bacterium]|nr:hypothetical protein [Bacteriovoracaceae bacterium]